MNKVESKEPTVVYATVRDSEDFEGYPILDIECRFSNGEKIAAIQVDYEFPDLAFRIAKFLNLLQKEVGDERK